MTRRTEHAERRARGESPASSGARPAEGWVAYDFAVLRAVPHPYLGAFVNIGVVLHARTAGFLGIRLLHDRAALRARIPDVDVERLARYLEAYEGICAGNPDRGPVALAPPSERFHWLTAPRSDVIQPSPIHEGLARDPSRALDELFGQYVTGAAAL